MAPGLVTAEKAARGKLPTDVWWHTIVPTNGKEKTGYADAEAGGSAFGGWFSPRLARAIGASTSLPEAARSAPSPQS